MSLSHEHITQALLTSDDDGETLNLANWGFTEVSEASAEELASVGKSGSEDDGIVTRFVAFKQPWLHRPVASSLLQYRIALNSNLLTTLPRSFELIRKLRYLNLRANSFTAFPLVVS